MAILDVSNFPDSAVHMVGHDARASKDFGKLCLHVNRCMESIDERLELVRAPVWFFLDGFWYAIWRAKFIDQDVIERGQPYLNDMGANLRAKLAKHRKQGELALAEYKRIMWGRKVL